MVLDLVDLSVLSEDEREMVVVRPYMNGREHGFSVAVRSWLDRPNVPADMQLAFAEYRSSDSIVVYASEDNGEASFDERGIPRGEAWRNAREFRSEAEAAAFVQEVVVAAARAACAAPPPPPPVAEGECEVSAYEYVSSFWSS